MSDLAPQVRTQIGNSRLVIVVKARKLSKGRFTRYDLSARFVVPTLSEHELTLDLRPIRENENPIRADTFREADV